MPVGPCLDLGDIVVEACDVRNVLCRQRVLFHDGRDLGCQCVDDAPPGAIIDDRADGQLDVR